MLYLLLPVCLTVAAGHSFHTAYSWKQIEFKFPNDDVRNAYAASGDYIPGNNMPLGLAVWRDRMFVTVPRWKRGVLATLNSFSMSNSSRSPILEPYPDLKTNDLRSPDGLVNIFRVKVDCCDRLWGFDMGTDDILGNETVVRPMKLVVFDLKTDTIVRRYALKNTDVMPDTFIANLEIDVTPGRCDDAYAYMSDLTAYGLVVYSWRRNDSWRINHDFFRNDPENGNFSIQGYNFTWTDGIFGMSLLPSCFDESDTLYFHVMTGLKEFSVPTSILREKGAARPSSDNDSNFRVVGIKGDRTQGPSSIIDLKTRVMYFTQINRNGVACWDIDVELNPETFKLVAQDNTTLVFPQDLTIDSESRKLYALSDNFQRFQYDDFDLSETNFYITSADLEELTAQCKRDDDTSPPSPSQTHTLGNLYITLNKLLHYDMQRFGALY